MDMSLWGEKQAGGRGGDVKKKRWGIGVNWLMG